MFVQAQMRIPRDTGLPGDVTTNTFHFDMPITQAAADFDALTARLLKFYRDTAIGETIPVRQALNQSVLGNVCQIRFYNAEAPDVGGPLAVRQIAVEWTGGGVVPEEVATCLSYKAEPVVNVPPSRLRGRIFLGPLASDALEIVGGAVRVKQNYRTAILASAKESLMNSQTFPWVVFSRGKGTPPNPAKGTAGTADWTPFVANVNQAWMDDAPDTIRSRGAKPTARTVINAAF